MMERPEPVRRVTPPSTIITRTMAAVDEQPGRHEPPATTAGRTVYRRRIGEFANVEGHGTLY